MSPAAFDIALPHRRLTAPEAVALASEAEHRGWNGVWLPEVLGLDALVMHGVIATATTRVRLGTSIVPISTRSVALLGMGASTIAQLAPGRFHLGLGVSTEAIVGSRHDRPVRRPLAEARGTLEVLRDLLGGKDVDRPADPVVTGLRIEPSSEPPKLVLAALGPKMLGLAHELADGVMLNLLPLEEARKQSELGRQRGREGFESLMLVRVCIDPTDDDRLSFSREVASYGRVDAYAANFARCGYELDGVRAASDLAQAVERLPAGLVDDVILSGSAETVGARLRELRAAGVSPVVMAAGAPGSLDRVIDRLDPAA